MKAAFLVNLLVALEDYLHAQNVFYDDSSLDRTPLSLLVSLAMDSGESAGPSIKGNGGGLCLEILFGKALYMWTVRGHHAHVLTTHLDITWKWHPVATIPK